MCLLFIVAYAQLCEIVQSTGKYPVVICVHNLTSVGCYYIIMAPFLVQTQGKGAVFHLVAKRKLHFAAVSPLPGASFMPSNR